MVSLLRRTCAAAILAAAFFHGGATLAQDAGATAVAAPTVPAVEPLAASGFPVSFAESWMETARFADLPGWAHDRHEAAMAAFVVSCRPIVERATPPRVALSIWLKLREICPHALALPQPVGREEARRFFETFFRPVRMARLDQEAGFLTGYYEPEVEASRVRTEEFATPFLGRPDDLVSSRPGNTGFDARASAGRWVDGAFVPYFDRGDIERGALDGRSLELAWVRDPVDVMFTQIQGSARLRMTDGSVVRIGYAAHNGHRYVPVGRVLVERGIATREQMSMDFIRAWMRQNPEAARDVRWQNRSYVFFRLLSELSATDGPIGGQGVPVSDWRTIAVDRNIHAYGTPIFIDGVLPTGPFEAGEPFQRLMIAQDTGSAILGPARGDLYLGSGAEAGSVSGRIRHRAHWYTLLPVSLSPEAAQVPVPLPRTRRR